MTLIRSHRLRGINIMLGLVAILMLSACDAAQNNEAQVPVTLEIDARWVLQNELDSLADEMRQFLHTHGYAFLSLKQQDDGLILFYRPQADHNLPIELQTSFPHTAMNDQADPQASDRRQIRIQLPTQTRTELMNKSRATNMQVIEKSFLQAGVQVKIIPTSQARFTVGIPKSKYDPKQLQAMTRFQQLEFYLVSQESEPAESFIVQDKDGKSVSLEREPVLSGKAIEYAEAIVDRQFTQPVLNVSLHDEEAEIMQALTQENIGRSMAVVLKTERQVSVLSVARIQGVFGKRFMITGLDSLEAAKNLATALSAGELAAPVRVVSEKSKTE